MEDISRRNFLKAGAITAGILLLPSTSLVLPPEKPEAERLSDLTKIVVLRDQDRKLEFDKLNDGNSYFLGNVTMKAAFEIARAYFPKDPALEKNISGILPYNVARDIRFMVGDTSVAINYIRKFRDGLVQMAGFGGEWGTQPGTCWGFYAHLVNPIQNTRFEIEFSLDEQLKQLAL